MTIALTLGVLKGADSALLPPPHLLTTMTYASRETTPSDAVPSDIKYLSHSPSRESRLGDIGYVDERGNWRKILNIFDQESCRQLGIKTLRLERSLSQYITQTKYSRSATPIVKLYNGGKCRFLDRKELA